MLRVPRDQLVLLALLVRLDPLEPSEQQDRLDPLEPSEQQDRLVPQARSAQPDLLVQLEQQVRARTQQPLPGTRSRQLEAVSTSSLCRTCGWLLAKTCTSEVQQLVGRTVVTITSQRSPAPPLHESSSTQQEALVLLRVPPSVRRAESHPQAFQVPRVRSDPPDRQEQSAPRDQRDRRGPSEQQGQPDPLERLVRRVLLGPREPLGLRDRQVQLEQRGKPPTPCPRRVSPSQQ